MKSEKLHTVNGHLCTCFTRITLPDDSVFTVYQDQKRKFKVRQLDVFYTPCALDYKEEFSSIVSSGLESLRTYFWFDSFRLILAYEQRNKNSEYEMVLNAHDPELYLMTFVGNFVESEIKDRGLPICLYDIVCKFYMKELKRFVKFLDRV